VNEPLRRALLQARLRENDVAARLGVDPKTVRRWLNGRVPYAHNRTAIADLVGADEGTLWPDAGGPLAARSRPDELGTVYPHRWAVPREVWTELFDSAEHEIGILAYSALFLAEDTGILRIRLHRTVPYNSIYRTDGQLMVNQHTYGIPAAQAPVFCLRDTGGEMAALYRDSFDRV
jgi:transcriptional regulator with XRE-family HTH domain